MQATRILLEQKRALPQPKIDGDLAEQIADIRLYQFEVNKEREDHIITLEDPIEYVFTPKGCHINQREVGSHTKSFAAALRGFLGTQA